MMRIFLCSVLLLFACGPLRAQLPGDSTDNRAYIEEAKQMTRYLARVFNILGDPTTPASEKEIIINQSYDKIFRDAEVQIEDDLIPDRSTVTNKNVQAYLKDIDFFFQEVNFEFLIQSVTPNLNEQGGGYLLIELERRLRGITVEGDSINDSRPRYIEMNLYPEDRVLKIASIYTSRLSEEEDLANWWQSLPPAWRRFIAPDIRFYDSLTLLDLMQQNQVSSIEDTLLIDRSEPVVIADSATLLQYDTPARPLTIGDTVIQVRYDTILLNDEKFFNQLRQVLRRRSLDLSGMVDLSDLSPLSKLRQLRELNLSRTEVTDLSPLRNLAHLRSLNLSHTPVADLRPLRYCDALQTLDLSYTRIDDLNFVVDLPQLQRLTVAHTAVTDPDPLASCDQLTELDLADTKIFQIDSLIHLSQLAVLDLSGTAIYNLEPLASLNNLRTLNAERTNLAGLGALANVQGLRQLRVDSTRVLTLDPLIGLKDLQKVYCDQTLVGRYEVNQFRQVRPDVMVVFASASLREWWNDLSPGWQHMLWPQGNGATPSREALHAISRQDSLDLSGWSELQNLLPLKALSQLRVLDMSYTRVDSLGPLSEAEYLRVLNCSHTPVRSLDPLRYLRRLQFLDCSYTRISELEALSGINALSHLNLSGNQLGTMEPLYGLSSLQRVEADDTPWLSSQVADFLLERPGCLVIFQSNQLQSWWEGLAPTWRSLLTSVVRATEPVSSDDWHRMIALVELTIEDAPDIQDLTPLKPFLRLEQLHLRNTGVETLDPLASIVSLRELSFPKHRVRSLNPLHRLNNLSSLNCENTPVEELDPLSSLFRLEDLNCAGTQVDELDALESMFQLRRINCSNTQVKKLKPLYTLPRLEVITCFNTRVSDRRIEKFKEKRPKVEIVYY